MSGVGTLPRTDRQRPYGPAGRSAWLDVDWREHQRWVTVGARPVNVIELGEGPAIVFVHGLSGSWPNWLEQLPVFARDHRVIASACSPIQMAMVSWTVGARLPKVSASR